MSEEKKEETQEEPKKTACKEISISILSKDFLIVCILLL